MATPSASSDAPAATSTPRKYNLRNPLPLSATQEQEVKQMYYKRVRSHCAPEIKGPFLPLLLPLHENIVTAVHQTLKSRKLSPPDPQPPHSNLQCQLTLSTAFAECAVNRTVTATWVCRSQRLAMNSCMIAHANPEEEDRAREDWFATHEDRRREKEAELVRTEKRREEVIRMMREDEARRRQQAQGR